MTPHPPLTVGERTAISASRYRTIAKLGEGGMAEVFLALQTGISSARRLAVIKRLRTNYAESEEHIQMFREEARLATLLNHPNIVHTYEIGQDGHRHFMSMEYLTGKSYSQVLRGVGRRNFDFAMSVRICIEVLKGLDYAHQLKDFNGVPLEIVHRDISPSNVFITYDGRIKILDFGIAKAQGSSIETQAGTIKGKLTYMAPEQARAARKVTFQADLYAVGVMIWEAAAGRRRWEKQDDVIVFGNLLSSAQPEPPGAAKRGLPEEVDQLCLKALAPDPKDRFRDAADFRKALEDLLTRLPTRPTPEDIGVLLGEQFADERLALQRKVEEKLQEPEPSEEPSVASLIWFKGELRHGSEYPGDWRIHKAKPTRQRWIAAGLALAAVAALALGFTLRSTPTEEVELAATNGASPQSSNVMVRIKATPSEAKLFWDDRPLKTNPYEERLTRSNATVTLRAEAEGFAPQTAIVSLDAERDVHFHLDPLPATSASVSTTVLDLDDIEEPEGTVARARVGTTRTAAPRSATSKPTTTSATARPKKPARVQLDTSNPWDD